MNNKNLKKSKNKKKRSILQRSNVPNFFANLEFDKNKEYSIGSNRNKLKNIVMGGSIYGSVNFNNKPTINSNSVVTTRQELDYEINKLSASIINIEDSSNAQLSNLSTSIINIEESTNSELSNLSSSIISNEGLLILNLVIYHHQ